MNVLDGGRDARVRPLSRRARIACWSVLAVVVAGSAAMLVARFA
jgi:hypothetical protein